MNRVALLVVATVLTSGCATILNDDTQRINVSSSNNQPFEGTINGRPFTGPGIVAVTRARQDAVVNVDTEGCQTQTLVPSKVDNKFFINILSGGSFGSTTDYASDRMWQYEDNVVVSCQ